jgi:hypothetical protein
MLPLGSTLLDLEERFQILIYNATVAVIIAQKQELLVDSRLLVKLVNT